MNAKRHNEITGSIIALTAIAGLATGLVATQDAYAAPQKTKAQAKSKVIVQRKQKPVYVKMVGDRRAAQSRADQLYAQAVSEAAAQRETDALLAQQQQQQENNSVTEMTTGNPDVLVPGPYPGSYNAGPNITFTNNPFSGYVGYGPESFIGPNFSYGSYNGFVGGGVPGNNYVVVPGAFFGGGPGYQIGSYSPTGVTFGFGY